MSGGGLDGTGAEGEAVGAEQGVVHPLSISGEVAASQAACLAGLGRGGGEASKGGEDGADAPGEQVGATLGRPGGGGRSLAEAGPGNHGEMLGGMIEVDDLDPF